MTGEAAGEVAGRSAAGAWGCGVIDPLSVSAMTAFLGSVAGGVADESGRRLCEAVGAVVARVAGREVTVPSGPAEREAVARVLVEGARHRPEYARALAVLMDAAPGGPVAAAGPPPRQLPAPVRFFTDRKGPLGLLGAEASRRAGGRPRVAVVHGPEGIGTSELVFHWGAREAGRYPDGVLYADVRGGGSPGAAPNAAVVLGRFLARLHVPAERIPPALGDRAELYRSLVAERRLLVVLDHVQSAAQVLPLVTAAPEVFTVVVARRPPAGLDAVPVPVHPLRAKDARQLLVSLAGKQAVTAARAALPSILERCEGSPFALRAAALDLTVPVPGAVRPDEPVSSAVDWQYAALSPEAARVFRLAALWPWDALSAGPVAAAAGVGQDEAARALDRLAGRRLLETTSDGRYRFRPAVRAYAARAAAREDGRAGCEEAVGRTAEWFLRFAVQADFAALKNRWHLGPLYRELGPGPYAGEGEAIAALLGEAGNLVEAVLAAEDCGRPAIVCQLVEALYALQLKAGQHEVLLPALRAGVRVAGRHCPGTQTAGRLHTQLAMALTELAAYGPAEQELTAAAEAEERAGHLRGRATAVETLGLLRLRQWRFQPALECFGEAGRLLDGIGPGDTGAGDLPRARALLQRHRGRALRGMDRFEEARPLLEAALAFFRRTEEPYNVARVQTDLAEVHIARGQYAEALRLIDRAAVPLIAENAVFQLEYLDVLRRRIRAEQA